ncbi:MAG: hypothetical protein AMXMBFR33_47300 [Candidatus Xenobia bacterium]|jgi:ubiquinone/menaquinone biosynthesis C-methylase UbiE
MYSRSARFYDAIYGFKDYEAECRRLVELVGPGGSLLDVACGTGLHARQLTRSFQVTGVDLDSELLEVARANVPQAQFLQADMRSFDLGRTFRVVTCLFSSIAYVKTEQALHSACACLARHLEPGGKLLVEPWLRREMLKPGHVGLDTAECDGVRLARMSTLEIVGELSVIHFHYLIGSAEGIVHETEDHELALFTLEQYRQALEQAGLQVEFEPEGLCGRGLFTGVRVD